jgi:hypothetical protein
MNAAEALTLCRFVKAVCPQQVMDEFSPDAWLDLLGDLRFQDAREAVRNLGQQQHFIDPADIRKEVRRIRDRRIAEHPPIDPPDTITTDHEYRIWLRTTRQAIADGDVITQPALQQRDMSQLRAIDKRPA